MPPLGRGPGEDHSSKHTCGEGVRTHSFVARSGQTLYLLAFISIDPAHTAYHS